jgi:NitT/TauT family transport system permease protein
MTTTFLRRPSPRLVRWGLVVAALALLELLTRGGQIDPLTLPPPTDIAEAAWKQLGTAQFRGDLERTGFTVLISIGIAIVVGVALGTLCWRIRLFGDVLEPYLSALYAMPTLVFYPVLLSVMGLTMWPVVVIATIMVIVPVALNTMVGFRNLDPVLPKMGHSMSAGRLQLFFKIMLPGAMPLLISGLKLGCIYAMIGTVAMEFILADKGLGFRVGIGYKDFNIVSMWANILVITVLTVAVTWLLGLLERRVRRDMA